MVSCTAEFEQDTSSSGTAGSKQNENNPAPGNNFELWIVVLTVNCKGLPPQKPYITLHKLENTKSGVRSEIM